MYPGNGDREENGGGGWRSRGGEWEDVKGCDYSARGVNLADSGGSDKPIFQQGSLHRQPVLVDRGGLHRGIHRVELAALHSNRLAAPGRDGYKVLAPDRDTVGSVFDLVAARITETQADEQER